MPDSKLLARLRVIEGRDGSSFPAAGLTNAELWERELCEQSFFEFVKRAWNLADPTPLIGEAWHLKTIADAVQTAHDNGKNLMVCVPPGMGKSMLVSVLYPCWAWALEPRLRFLTSAHSMQLSTRDARRSRDVIKSSWYSRLWPHVRLVADQDQKTRYVNVAGGTRVCTSTSSRITGERADVVLADDPIDIRARFYTSEIDSAVEHWRSVLRSRGSGRDTRYLVVLQRIAFEDFAAAILEESELGGLAFDLLALPMVYDSGWAMQLPSGVRYGPDERDERRPRGRAAGRPYLFPEKFPHDEIRRLRVTYGSAADAILDQAPTRETGALVRGDWLRYFYPDHEGEQTRWLLDRAPAPPAAWTRRQLSVVCTVDLATSLSESADFTCFEAWGITPDGDYLLLDVFRERLPGERHLPALTSFCAKWCPIRIYVESVGYQLAFVQQAQAKGLPVEPLRRDRGQHKELRVIPLVQACADGRVYLDALAGWLDVFEREVLTFPNSRHDDQVDCASDAVTVLASGVWAPARTTERSLRHGLPDYNLPFRDDPYGVRTGKTLFEPPDGLWARPNQPTFDPPS